MAWKLVFPTPIASPICAQDRDLDVHINREISRSLELQAILASSSPGLDGRITLAIKRKCSGMFLHASLQLQALQECTSRRELNRTLEEFPAKIADVYAQTWDRIINQAPDRTLLAMNVLRWVLYATRSLAIEELRHALASCPDTHNYEPSRLVAPQTLVGVCCGLLLVEKETRQVRLVHYSAKAVLQTLMVGVTPHPHSLPAFVCINRLCHAGLQSSSVDSKEDFDAAMRESPLLPYAYDSWSDHARESLDDDISKSHIATFVQGCHGFPILIRKYGPWRRFAWRRFGPLHVAAYFDLPPSLAGSTYLRNINLPRIKLNAVDRDGWSALIWASDLGHEQIVKILVSHPQIKVNQIGDGGVTALHRASQGGHTPVVKTLLANPKIKVNQALDKRLHGATPLILASFAGKADAVTALLGHPQINVNMLGGVRSWPALMYAVAPALGNGEEVVKALLAHPQIDINQRGKDGWTALHVAKRYKHKAVEDILLEYSRTTRSVAPKAGGSEDTRQSSLSRVVDDLSRLSLPFGKR
ncbi:ankyrin repeat-containing domain protein [Coprinopsis sp. MPI-PUGE-AT-0042]|nr:ankyrin repeat-containing domain protein [Coprinopsis sp. MPI-PUGE-AT-0042]